MNKLREKFDLINKKFIKRKSFYKRVIEKLAFKRDLSLHKSVNDLYDRVEASLKDITESLASTVEGQPNLRVVRKKIKDLSKSFKKLHDVTKPVWRQWLEAVIFAGSLVFIIRTYIFGLYHVPTGSAEPTILVGDRLWGNKMIYYFNKIKQGDSVIFDNPKFIYDKSSLLNSFWQKYVGFPIPLLGLGVGPDNWVKRVVAIPGDVIEGRIEDDKTVIYRNGKKINETGHVNPYPLICLKKSVGFLPFNHIGMFSIPSFLVNCKKLVFYTYDFSKSFDDQPFYSMSNKDVRRDVDNNLILKYAYSPSYIYDYNTGDIEGSVDNFGPIRIPEGKYWVMGDSRKNSEDSRFWGLLDESLIHGRASFIIYSVDSEEVLWIFELLKHPIDFWMKSVRWNRFLKWIK